jgi:hypothetical protein
MARNQTGVLCIAKISTFATEPIPRLCDGTIMQAMLLRRGSWHCEVGVSGSSTSVQRVAPSRGECERTLDATVQISRFRKLKLRTCATRSRARRGDRRGACGRPRAGSQQGGHEGRPYRLAIRAIAFLH